MVEVNKKVLITTKLTQKKNQNTKKLWEYFLNF